MSEGDEEEVKKNKKTPAEIMQPYIPNILEGLVALLQKGIQSNYEPLQTEVLSLIMVIAEVIEADFAPFYNKIMPLMTEVLTNVPMETMSQKKLRAKAIETIGSMIIAVAQS